MGEEVDIAGLGNPRGNFASGSSNSAAAVSAGDSYGAPLADPVGAGSTAPIDEYGAPAGPILTDSSSPPEATAPIDEYGAPTTDVLPASSAPVGDSYGAPTSDILPASSSAEVVAADSGYGAPAEAPLIQDNSFAPSSVDEATVAVGDSYGSPRDPAPSSYDAPAVPAGGARYNRRNWSHQLL